MAVTGSTKGAPRRRIDIVGGGIAGLALAAGLDPDRWSVTVHEAEPEREALGAGIGLWPAAQRALRRLGAWPEIAGHLGPVESGSLFTGHGRRLLTLRTPPVALIDRPRLLAALVSALPASMVRQRAQIDDPTALEGAVVVGADGVRSRVRALVVPAAAERIETPYVTLRGVLPTIDPGAVGEYWGSGRLFGLAPLSGGRGYWFTAHRSGLGPEPLELGRVLSEARRVFAGAAPVIRHCLEHAGAATLATRLWVAPALPRYARGRFVVIGDAAHAALPNLGRGGCDALLDAVSLADVLNRDGSLTGWQARRLPVTQLARAGAGALMRVALADRVSLPRARGPASSRASARPSAGPHR